jgi:hypothetical protein
MLDAAPAFARTSMRLTFNAMRLPAWLRFDRRDFGLAMALAAVSTVVYTSGAFFVLRERSLLEIIQFTASLFAESLAATIAIVIALKAAETLPIRGWHRTLVTAAIGVAVTIVINGPHYYLDWPFSPAGVAFGIASSSSALFLNSVWTRVALALIARAWLVRTSEETQARDLLARMRAEQMSVRRRLVEGRLKAIQARVDPLFFFAMLDAVQKIYAVDSHRAEQLLDELTAFLRAALPRLRTASSSVDQECDLARSFARLRALAGLGESRLDIDIAPSVGAANFPPGVVLPLIDDLLRGTADAGRVGISFSTDTDASQHSVSPDGSDHSTLSMHLTARSQPSIETLAKTRATLCDLFGPSADLTSIHLNDGICTVVRVPYEPAIA